MMAATVFSDGHQRLFCDEPSSQRRALPDPVLLKDERVLRSLLVHEDKEVQSTSYLTYTQADLQPYMRQVVVSWMLEVTEEQQCEEEVFPLSVIYLDQVVSALSVKKAYLQLTAAVCMFIASKFRDTSPVSAQNLVTYTDCSVTVGQLLDWELLVLRALKWNVYFITPHDFLDQFLSRLEFGSEQQRQSVRRHALAFIVLCIIDIRFVATPPSMISAGCIIAGATGLLGETWCKSVRLLARLHDITGIDMECLQQCHDQIEDALRITMTSDSSTTSSTSVNSKSNNNNAPGAQPSTPTDVRDIDLRGH